MRIIWIMFAVLLLFVATAGAQPQTYFAPPVTYYPVPLYYVPPARPVAYVAYSRPTWIGNFVFGPIWVPIYQEPQPRPQKPQE